MHPPGYLGSKHGTKDRSSEWKVTFNIQGNKLTLDIDSGTQCNILSKANAEQFSAISSRLKTEQQGKSIRTYVYHVNIGTRRKL